MRRGLVTVTVLGVALGGGVLDDAATAAAQGQVITLPTTTHGQEITLPLPSATDPAAPAANPPAQTGSTLPTIAHAPTPTTSSSGAQLALPGLSDGSIPAAAPQPEVAPPRVAGAKTQPATGDETVAHDRTDGLPFGSPSAKPTDAGATATTDPSADGVPPAVDPTLSVVTPGPVPVGVPDFFVDNFDVPPFLLPIFQAAGTRYDVPWQVLAAINQIETDYGRDLNVSSAGAFGWMQFLPQTWSQYGLDANGDGVKDPYNPADAIFTAARYLQAAGASQNLRGAIFAYNNANWYVDSVMLRAKLIGGMPASLVGSLTGLADGLFPVHAAARYTDETPGAAVLRSATSSANPTTPPAAADQTKIYAKAGSPVVAVNDGVITAIGDSPTLGGYVKLRDAYGNTYTYSSLGRLADRYAVPKVPVQPPLTPAGAAAQPIGTPRSPASAGHQTGAPVVGRRVGSTQPTRARVVATDTTAGPQRLFAHPNRAASFAAGGRQQVTTSRGTDLSRYLTQTDGFDPSQLDLKPLVTGAHVLAGAVVGWVGAASPSQKPHLTFRIRPAGSGAPQIDPKPVLDGWQLLDATSGARSAGTNALFGSAEENSRKAQILVETKAQLEQQVLADPSIAIYADGRRAIEAGQVDQQVLATLEFLSASGLRPTVSGLRGGGGSADSPAGPGAEVDISAINGIPVLGNQRAGSIADIAIRQLLGLPSTLQPLEIISLLSYPGNQTAVAMPDHADRISLVFPSTPDLTQVVGQLGDTVLTPPQWLKLITRIGQISNPVVPATPSSAAVPDQTGG